MQQTLLILAAQDFQPGWRIAFITRSQHLLRQLHGKIGIEQIQLERHLLPAQLLQFLILRKQAQCGVVRAIGQFIEVVR